MLLLKFKYILIFLIKMIEYNITKYLIVQKHIYLIIIIIKKNKNVYLEFKIIY